MKKRIFSFTAVILLLISTLSSLCSCSAQMKHITERFDCFDTYCSLTIYCNQEDFKLYESEFNATLEKYHKLLDTYNDYENTVNIKTLNEQASLTPIKVSAELFNILKLAKELFDVTYGKFNVAIGAVSSLWHEARIYSTKYPSKAYIPTSSEIQEALLHTDIKALILDEEMCSVFYSNKKLSLDLGAVAKGYVTSILHERLIELGCDNFLINLGGNVAAYGTKPKNESWNVKIENPFTDKSSGFNKIIKVNNSTIVTSGSYQRNFTFNGTEYSHVIDSTNGYPANIFASVSIQAPASSSALADALSTALFCMSYEDGLSLIEKLENIEALWIFNDGSFKATSGFGG